MRTRAPALCSARTLHSDCVALFENRIERTALAAAFPVNQLLKNDDVRVPGMLRSPAGGQRCSMACVCFRLSGRSVWSGCRSAQCRRLCRASHPSAGNTAPWGNGEFSPTRIARLPHVHLLDHYYYCLKTSPIASPMRCLGPALPAPARTAVMHAARSRVSNAAPKWPSSPH